MAIFGAIALLPILGLTGYHAWEETRVKLKQDRAAAGNLVTLIAAEQQLRFALIRQLQATLALNPVVAEPKDPAACSRVLEQARAGGGYLTGITLHDASGRPLCWATPRPPPRIDERDYFKDVLRQKQAVVSDYLIGGTSGKAILIVAHPIVDNAGAVSQVLVAGLDLAWLARTLEKTPLPGDTNLVLVDGKGVVLAPEKWLGRSVADHPVFQRVAASSDQMTFEARGIDGVERLFVARPLQKTTGGNILVWVAVSKDTVLRAAIVGFLAESLLYFLLAIILFIIIWRLGSRQVIGPIDRLKEAARHLGGIDLKARTGLPHGADEIGQLATSLDEMAEAVEIRETALLQSKESLLRANRALRVLSAGNQAVVRATDEAALLAEMCHIATAEGGYRLAWIGRAEDDPERSISVLAAAGPARDYAKGIEVSWADTERGRGPAGTAVRENRPFAVHSVAASSRFAPWREQAVQHGFEAVLGLPVSVAGSVWGVLCLYSSQTDAFDDEEIRLLVEMAEDLGFGIETLRLREKEAVAQEALRRVNEELEARVIERTADLAQANRELEAFSYSASHDLRAPLRSMAGFAEVLHEDYGDRLDEEGRAHLERICAAARRMSGLIDAMYHLSRLSHSLLQIRPLDLSEQAEAAAAELRQADPARQVEIVIAPGLRAEGDPALLRVLLGNLLGNAWKYTARAPQARIEFLQEADAEGRAVFVVRDNGVGFDMQFADKLFRLFQRLHRDEDFAGQGVGLVTAQRIVGRHGGRIWGRGEKGRGAEFRFTLWDDPALRREAEADLLQHLA